MFLRVSLIRNEENRITEWLNATKHRIRQNKHQTPPEHFQDSSTESLLQLSQDHTVPNGNFVLEKKGKDDLSIWVSEHTFPPI